MVYTVEMDSDKDGHINLHTIITTTEEHLSPHILLLFRYPPPPPPARDLRASYMSSSEAVKNLVNEWLVDVQVSTSIPCPSCPANVKPGRLGWEYLEGVVRVSDLLDSITPLTLLPLFLSLSLSLSRGAVREDVCQVQGLR